MPPLQCGTCSKVDFARVEIRLSRHGKVDWVCLPCATKAVLRAQRLGIKGIVAPEKVWAAVAMELERATQPEPAKDGWLSRDQAEWVLRREAEATATALGHELGTWGITMAICQRCNRVAYAIPRTLGPSLSGPVLSMECTGPP